MFNENLSRGKGDMEWTPHSKLNPMTFNCDLHLELTYLSHGFCLPSQSEIKFYENPSGDKVDFKWTQNLHGNPKPFNCDIEIVSV